jgi:RNA polymerase sigma-70 factor (ECF subfamily)
MTDLELAQVIRRAQDREPAAFDALIDAYGRRLHGYLYRLTGSKDDADDLLQELFLRLVRTIDGYVHDGRFDAWLFRIATNLVRDRLRRSGRSPAKIALDSANGGAEFDEGAASLEDTKQDAPDSALELREEADAVQRALASLPGAEREVVMLRHFSELSFPEIARLMGTPLGTALARAHRGLAKLRMLLAAGAAETAKP